jgi:hypothetical protein
MDIGIELVTDRNVGLKFDTFPKEAYKNLFDVITEQTGRLQEQIVANTPKRTGRLASEIHARVVTYSDRITGSVSVSGGTSKDYAKAGAEEYGAHGTAHVHAHHMKLGHLFSKIVEPMDVVQGAYDRHVNIDAREYLRGPLHEIQDDIIKQMKDAVDAATTA